MANSFVQEPKFIFSSMFPTIFCAVTEPNASTIIKIQTLRARRVQSIQR